MTIHSRILLGVIATSERLRVAAEPTKVPPKYHSKVGRMDSSGSSIVAEHTTVSSLYTVTAGVTVTLETTGGVFSMVTVADAKGPVVMPSEALT